MNINSEYKSGSISKEKKIEAKINRLADKLIILRDNNNRDTDEWMVTSRTLVIECIAWVKINRTFKKYVEIDYDEKIKKSFIDFKYDDVVIEMVKKAIDIYEPSKGKNYINFLTTILSNELKKEDFYSEQAIKLNYKKLCKIRQLEKVIGLHLNSPDFKRIAISNGYTTEKEYNDFCKISEYRNISSLNNSFKDKDGEESEFIEYVAETKADYYKEQQRADKICEKLLQCINFIYKTKTRKDAVIRDSNIYTYFVLEILTKLPEEDLNKKCQKYKFINKEAVLHFAKNKDLPTQEVFADFTNTKASRYHDKIEKLKELLKANDELQYFYKKNI